MDDSTPPGTVNLLVVLLHELGNGFGVLTFTNTSAGAFACGFPDVRARTMLDRTLNPTWFNNGFAKTDSGQPASGWPQLAPSGAQRVP